MLFKIKENEGLGYSKFSGDKNKKISYFIE